MILNHPTLSESEVKLLVQAADSVYQNQMSLDGWDVITSELTNPNYGLDPQLVTGNTYNVETGSLNLPFVDLPYGDANAALLKSGDNLLLAFRGTEIPEGDYNYWLRLGQHYDLFEPLFQALDNYTQANPASKILVTGHSLGAAMAELYMAEHPGALYSAVTVASPTASNDPTDTRVLNIGFENDPVYEITSGDPFGGGIGGADPNNSTTDLFLNLDSTGLFGINNHASSEYIYAVERLFDSAYYDRIERDSFVIIDHKNSNTNVSDVFLSTNKNVFILGEDDKADNIKGDKKNDVLVGLGGDDTLKGDLISASFFSGDDTLDGGSGNDILDGSKGEDLAVFSGSFADYDFTLSTDKKTITVDHARGTQEDGTDTVRNTEFALFQDVSVPSGNIARRSTSEAETVTRIVPLPLTDGVEETESVQATDTTANPNSFDPPTPPNVSLTAPVAMLDGDIDYTLDISPYQPDTKYNIAYIIDTSGSLNDSELQATKDAYTDLTNYFVDAGIAENINFGVVKFARDATLYSDLNANEAVSTIQSLTTASAIQGTDYYDGLDEGVNFFNNSPEQNRTNIAFFTSEGRSYPGGSPFAPYNPNDLNYNFAAIDLRDVAHVQSFGYKDAVSNQVNFIDSNNGVMMSGVENLPTEILKSDLADDVESVNILVDGEIVDTLTPDQFTDSPLGLTYSGSVENESAIENLDVSIDAENIVTAEVVFTPESNFATTAVEHTVTAGDSEAVDENGNPIDQSGNSSGDEDPFERQLDGSDGKDKITLGYADRGANGGAGSDKLIGNNRDNILNAGAGNDRIFAHDGNDTITTGGGIDLVSAGSGIDTVLYKDVTYQNNSNVFLRQSGNTVNYNNTDTLTDVEFLQFADVRISASTLEVTPTLEVGEVRVTEGSSRNTFATFTFDLSTPAPVDVRFDYSTQDLDAVAVEDYISASGQVVIPAGETTASMEVEIVADTAYDELTETFGLNLSGLSGATFNNNEAEYDLVAYIENRAEGVVDENNQPVLVNSVDDLTAIEDEEFSFILAEDTFNDVDAGDRLTYVATLADGSQLPDWLSFDADTRSFSGTPVNNDVGTVSIQITATDLAGETATDSFNLEVANANDAPLNINLSNASIDENSSDGTVIGNLSTVDRDLNDTHTYTLLNNADGRFTIDGSQLQVADGNTLNFEANSNHLIEIQTTDAGGLSTDKDFNINLNDLNEAPIAVNDSFTANSKSAKVIAVESLLNNDRDPENGSLDLLTVGNAIDGTVAIDGDNVVFTPDGNSSTGGFDYTISDGVLNSSASVTLDLEVAEVGSNDSDTIIGTPRNDVYQGLDGDDNISGKAGDDFIRGNADNDTIDGGLNNDTIIGDEGNDSLKGGSDLDILKGNAGNDRLFGENDDDLLQGSFGSDILEGGAGSDRLFGNEGSDLFRGGSGDDTLSGGAGFGKDILKGEDGNDSITGGGGDDLLQGGDDNDSLYGNGGSDRLYGNAGNDLFRGGTGNDLLSGGAGSGKDTLKGEDGNDSITGGSGDDLLQGGDDNDSLFGNAGSDRLYGNAGNDRLYGSAGDDLLSGSSGIDRLQGGSGNDILTGGSSRDNFVFANSSEGTDTITDFSVQDDTMWFVTSGFAGISTKGMVSSQMLTLDSDATSSSHRFIYNSGSGDLFYDADGSGSSAKVLLAELDSGLALTNADFRML